MSYESSPMSLEKVTSTAVKKTAVETVDQKLSNHNVTSTHGNVDGNCMKPGPRSVLLTPQRLRWFFMHPFRVVCLASSMQGAACENEWLGPGGVLQMHGL